MSILQDIFSEQFIYALGWTLIHSLWQGALIGLVIAVAMIFLHKYTARLRYFIYSISLFVAAGLAVVTFIGSYGSFQSTDADITRAYVSSGAMLSSSEGIESLTSHVGNESAIDSFLESTASYCRTHIPLFVIIWLLGMLASMLRFLGGYALVRRYRHHRVKPVMGEWERRFRQMASRVKVKQNVRLLESALVKVPMAIGYLKPVVLLPLGALNGVSAEQMEAILAHELAHIRRRDYLMNLIQSLLEVIFFYHPVIWWLSRNIRIERENICDDIAITITGNTMEFAKALTNIQEINLTAPGLAAGLSGKNKNRLINRIRRLAGTPKQQSGFAEGFIAASILVISLIGLSAAAMITYPVNKSVDPVINFSETSIELPGFTYFTSIAPSPDTTIKKEEKAKEPEAKRRIIYLSDSTELSKEELEKIHEAEAEIEALIDIEISAEIEALEAKLEAMQAEAEQKRFKALQEYEEAFQSSNYDRQQYITKTHEAMEAYHEAMEETQLRLQGSGHWSMPNMNYSPGVYKSFGDDSLIWTFEYPDNYILYCDSLKDFYFDEWDDQFSDFKEMDILIDRESDLMDLQEELMELEHLYIPRPSEPMVYSFNEGAHFFPSDFGISNRTKRIITDELRDDNLIDYGREYMILINKKQMLINGDKQSRSVFKKYRRLVDSMDEPWQFGDEDEFKIFIGH